MKQKCGQCLFAEGGEKHQFKNGDINYWYNCSLSNREENIVLLEYDETIVWENQNACENYEPSGKGIVLKKRVDLDKNEYHFTGEGHFEIVKNVNS